MKYLTAARDFVCVLLWNVVLVALTLPPFLLAKAGPLLLACVPGKSREGAEQGLARLVIRTTCLVWRLAIALCCWVRVRAEGLELFRRELGTSGRPSIILANHASFMDTVLGLSLMPVWTAGRVKMLVAQRIFEMPLLGTIASRMGHIRMPPKEKLSPEDYRRELERGLLDLEAVVAAGGIAAWFPEGRMNLGDPMALEPFKAGGLLMAARHDVEIWCVASVGQAVCWPRTSALGGRPCRIGCRAFRLCESSRVLVAQHLPGGGDERAASRKLAELAQAAMQGAVDELAAECGIARTGAPAAERPLLA